MTDTSSGVEHSRNASASSAGDDAWTGACSCDIAAVSFDSCITLLQSTDAGTAACATGYAGNAPEEIAEERMSVSAALQRFRRMERLSKEQHDLAEQQLAILEAQRLAALSNRASHSGSGSPVVSSRILHRR